MQCRFQYSEGSVCPHSRTFIMHLYTDVLLVLNASFLPQWAPFHIEAYILLFASFSSGVLLTSVPKKHKNQCVTRRLLSKRMILLHCCVQNDTIYIKIYKFLKLVLDATTYKYTLKTVQTLGTVSKYISLSFGFLPFRFSSVSYFFVPRLSL